MQDRPSHALARAGRLAVVALCLALAAFASPARAEEPVHGTVKISREDGFTRMLFRFDQEVAAKVTTNNLIMIINFARPVNVDVDTLNAAAPDLISAARRDPDGSAVRIALAHRIKLNVMPAAERVFVDLLPEKWIGPPPGLPQAVIDDLAERARTAERQLERERGNPKPKQVPLVRVAVGVQPTVTRYMLRLVDGADVRAEQTPDKLTLHFDRQIKWDLADAAASLPPAVSTIDADMDFGSTTVTFALNGAPDVHTFREDQSLMVDVAGSDGARPKESVLTTPAKDAAASPVIEAPETIAAKDGSAPAADAKAEAQPQAKAPPPQAQAKPEPKAESKAEAKPEQKPEQKSEQKSEQKPAVEPAQPMPKAADAKPDAKPAAPSVPIDPNAPVPVGVQRAGDTLRLTFAFAAPTPAAVFRRADVLWIVFDSKAVIDPAALNMQGTIKRASLQRGADGEQILRLKLDRPRLISAVADNATWTVTIADTMVRPPQPLAMLRNATAPNRGNIAIPFEAPSALHDLRDPEIGDRLMVITAAAPSRGFLKDQHFVELRTLASSQGIIIQPVADDLAVKLTPDKIVVSRPGGLSLSATTLAKDGVLTTLQDVSFDPQVWGFDRSAPFLPRQTELLNKAAAAEPAKRKEARFNLARFYLAQGMATEAKAVLDVALGDQPNGDEVTGSILRAVSEILIDRSDEAIKDLSAPRIGNQQDAGLWRGVAFAREGKWKEARERFKDFDIGMATLPIVLKRLAMKEALRAAIEVQDYTGAARLINEFDTIGVPPDMKPAIDVLRGRIAEGLGRKDDALKDYRSAVGAADRKAAAQGRLREIELLFSSGDMSRADVIGALETLTTVWRGDETETEGLRLLAHLYTIDGRYRDAFHVMKAALLAHPNSDITRKIQDEAATTFDALFLQGKGDAMPPVEALGLFYDYRELTPIGRRGDEMIRKLADRLVSVDLLDQAAELLQHQVDHRLEGAARAQVAGKLATIYLMNHKPERALAALQKTRSSDLANEVRDHRLLLEARALSELGRNELALELISNMETRQATRLRADILWAAKHWREAAEQIELLHGDRWKQFPPLDETERSDILRAAIGYALSGESISLTRLREKYAAKMAEGPDGRAFDVVSAPIGTSNAEFQDVARRVASIDTLGAFLKDIRTRYDEQQERAKAAPAANEKAPPKAAPVASKPAEKPAAKAAPVPPKAPKGEPLRADPVPTGSIPLPKR
ncbi:MAG: tetratricopeptide repeat protein [Pseudolabrys sp.]